MSSKQSIIEALEGMLSLAKADAEGSEWLYTTFDSFLANMKELQGFAQIDTQRESMAKHVVPVLGIPEEVVEHKEEKAEVKAEKVEAKAAEETKAEEPKVETPAEEPKVEAKPAAKKTAKATPAAENNNE